jgi:serine/threonine protein kinase
VTTVHEHRIPLGTTLAGRFTSGPLLGAPGARGAVYRAWDTVLTRYVAIKVIHPGLYQLHRADFDREATLLANLRSPHIIELLDVIEVDTAGVPTRALVMEEASRSLESMVGDAGPSTVEALHHTARGLRDVHAARCLHNDVKPSNILLVGERWKVGDFGIARQLDDGTHAFSAWADGDYAAPERKRGEIRTAGDVWSFAITATRCSPARCPPSGPTPPCPPACRRGGATCWRSASEPTPGRGPTSARWCRPPGPCSARPGPPPRSSRHRRAARSRSSPNGPPTDAWPVGASAAAPATVEVARQAPGHGPTGPASSPARPPPASCPSSARPWRRHRSPDRRSRHPPLGPPGARDGGPVVAGAAASGRGDRSVVRLVGALVRAVLALVWMVVLAAAVVLGVSVALGSTTDALADRVDDLVDRCRSVAETELGALVDDALPDVPVLAVTPSA